MTTKVLTGNYASGYALKAAYSGLEIATTAKVGGSGLLVEHTAYVYNLGTVAAVGGRYAGLYMENAGTVNTDGVITGYVGIKTKTSNTSPIMSSITNGGYIGGNYAGVEMGQVGYVSNLGSIHGARYGVDLVSYGTILNLGTVSAGNAGVELGSHGKVINGLGGRTGYQITGSEAGVSTVGSNAVVENYATITGGEVGVYLGHSGVLVNGPFPGRYGRIQGATGVSTNGSTAVVDNFGTISGTGGAGKWGVNLYDGGALYNYAHGAITGFSGLNDAFEAKVYNYGLIEGLGAVSGSYGVVMTGGGSLDNGSPSVTDFAVIRGYSGIVDKQGGATITNYALIQATGKYGASVSLAGGEVVNGGATAKSALITGGSGITFQDQSTLLNQGTIVGLTGSGVAMGVGGYVLNGGAKNKSALISGGSGGIVSYGFTTVVNFGTIADTGAYLSGVYTGFGGQITNGSTKDTTALISGWLGVRTEGYAATVGNFGSIIATGATNAYGVYLGDGGSVTNGSMTSTSALIEGYGGIDLVAGGAVDNFGSVGGTGGDYSAGVLIGAGGGVVVNGGAKDLTARISGHDGVATTTASAAVRNFATIAGASIGVAMEAGGSVTNGSTAVTTALIHGYTGLALQGASATNFGTILGQGGTFGYGAELNLNSSLVNGSAKDTSALVQGHVGVTAYAGSTVTNFGTVDGTGGVAVELTSPNARLVVEAGSKFIGQAYGDGGALELASGTGKLGGLFTNGDVSVYGSMPMTTFTDFQSLAIDQGATFIEKAGVSIASFEGVDDAGTLTLGAPQSKDSVVNAGLVETTGTGTLTIAGAVTNTGTLLAKGGEIVVDGAVTGAGTAAVNGGTLDLLAASSANVTFSGAGGVLELGQSQGYTGAITGFSKTGAASLDLADIGFVSTSEATYSGTKSGGVLTVTDGTHTARISLQGNYLASTFTCSSDGHGGTSLVDPTSPPPAARIAATATHQLVTAMAAMGAPAGLTARQSDGLTAHLPLLARPHAATA
jgi:hypothetical protein